MPGAERTNLSATGDQLFQRGPPADEAAPLTTVRDMPILQHLPSGNHFVPRASGMWSVPCSRNQRYTWLVHTDLDVGG